MDKTKDLTEFDSILNGFDVELNKLYELVNRVESISNSLHYAPEKESSSPSETCESSGIVDDFKMKLNRLEALNHYLERQTNNISKIVPKR